MEIKEFFGIVSGIIAVVCFVPYLRDIFRNKTKPHIYTWFIWSVLQCTAFFAMLSAGSGIFGVATLGIGSLFCMMIFLLSFRYGTKNISYFDTICFIGAILTLSVWIFLKNPLLSVILVCIIDIIGFLPTFRKSYFEPETETASTYYISAISMVFSLIALSSYTVTTMLYLVVLIFADTLCAVLILRRR